MGAYLLPSMYCIIYPIADNLVTVKAFYQSFLWEIDSKPLILYDS